MNKIQEVKQRADIVMVAEYFNLRTKQVCPFHKEKSASFSISKSKQVFHCFGCGVGGDVITLVSKLLNINAYESAKQINNICGLNIDFGKQTSNYEINKYRQIQKAKEQYKKWYDRTHKLLCEYYRGLQGIEKLQQENIVEYYIDLLENGTEEDVLWFKKHEERWCKEIERRITERKSAV